MDNRFIRAEEVAAELDVSKPYAYKLIRQLNEELKAKGFLTIAGRVNRQYFNERFYGTERKDADASLRASNSCISNINAPIASAWTSRAVFATRSYSSSAFAFS